jgi:periplasmic divalent cation tolerance protein
MKLLEFHTTVGSREDALNIANAVVSSKLVACVQIEAIESVYQWQGQVQQELEWRLTGKTVELRQKELSELVQEIHPYELPEMYFTQIEEASEAYSKWVMDVTGASPSL